MGGRHTTAMSMYHVCTPCILSPMQSRYRTDTIHSAMDAMAPTHSPRATLNQRAATRRDTPRANEATSCPSRRSLGVQTLSPRQASGSPPIAICAPTTRSHTQGLCASSAGAGDCWGGSSRSGEGDPDGEAAGSSAAGRGPTAGYI